MCKNRDGFLRVFLFKRNIDRFVKNLQGTGFLLPRADYDNMDWLAFPLQHKNRGGVIRFLEQQNVQIRVTVMLHFLIVQKEPVI